MGAKVKRLSIALVAALSLTGCATTSQADTCGRLLSLKSAAIAARESSLALLSDPTVSAEVKGKAVLIHSTAVATIAGIEGACPLPFNPGVSSPLGL